MPTYRTKIGRPDRRGYYRPEVGGKRFTVGHKNDISEGEAQRRRDALKLLYDRQRETHGMDLWAGWVLPYAYKLAKGQQIVFEISDRARIDAGQASEEALMLEQLKEVGLAIALAPTDQATIAQGERQLREFIDHDLDDYAAFLTKQLRSIRHFERCLFSVWCADHLLISHADFLAKNLSKSDLHTLRQIVDELWETLLGGVISGKDQLNALDMDYMAIDTGWGDLTRDVHPIATIVQQNVGICILCCRRNDVGLAQAVARVVIECLECKLEEDDPDCSPDRMFESPAIQHEIDAQVAMVKHLRGDYELTTTLRTMFR